ncbi:hypothetical protein AA21952_2207 [Acetobacter oeni LMG 21952]|nr:hypothetical protein AA21952_2207 [Acetobacter oeni LMG 21952]
MVTGGVGGEGNAVCFIGGRTGGEAMQHGFPDVRETFIDERDLGAAFSTERVTQSGCERKTGDTATNNDEAGFSAHGIYLSEGRLSGPSLFCLVSLAAEAGAQMRCICLTQMNNNSPPGRNTLFPGRSHSGDTIVRGSQNIVFIPVFNTRCGALSHSSHVPGGLYLFLRASGDGSHG